MLLRQLSRSHALPRFTRPIQLSSQRVVVYHSIPAKPPPRIFRRAHYPYGLLCATSVLAQQSPSRPDVLARRSFHSTPRRQAAPIVGLLGIMKASSILEIVRAASRIALTFIPLLLAKNFISRKFLRKVEAIQNNPHCHDHSAANDAEHQKKHHHRHDPEWLAEKRTMLLKGIRMRTIFFHLLMFVPCGLFALAVLASIERTPLTGRWRTIALSPEEEEAIAQQLAGSGWYQAVHDILARDKPPKLIPPSDWRYAWVYNTLRQLETAIPRLGDERSLGSDWISRDDDDIPLPPPSDYPLRPRPRASERIRLFRCTVTGETPARTVTSHHIPGPPYSLIVVDDPTACNAFSYGFGPDGAGGIVVFSGFIDRILRDHPSLIPPPPAPAPWYSFFLGSGAPPEPRPQPTSEQTADLAVLLSHELSHLVLAHHLETLSSMTVLVPGTLSIISDVLRTLLFPMTALFGPFVNDALASLGAAGSLELSKIGEYCTTANQEVEADVVSARLLAHAGFDPRRALRFWEHRVDAECMPGPGESDQRQHGLLAMKLFGAGHPLNEVRVQRLREELERWRSERERAAAEQAQLQRQFE